MNADMLTRLVNLLTPDSALGKLALLQPPRGPIAQNGRGHRRAGVTKNHSKPRNKTRVRMAKESRRRNRGQP